MKPICIFLISQLMFSEAYGSVSIDLDRDDCVDGWLSMDVKVRVDGESFRFDPSCAFSFDKTFTTANGDKCIVRAGMCSSFSPHNKFEVNCQRAGSATQKIQCP